MARIARKPGKIKKDELILRVEDRWMHDPDRKDILIGFKLTFRSRFLLLFGNTVYIECIGTPEGTIKEKE